MKEKEIKAALLFVGLNEVEIGIYMALLRGGKSTVSEIARGANLKRPTVYQYIDSLAAQDIIRKTVSGKRIMYYPEDPQQIMRMAKRAERKIAEVMPQLRELYAGSSIRPVVRFYEGKEPLRALYREVTKTSHTVWSVFAAERYFSVFSEKDGLEFLANIKSEGGSMRDLVLNTPDGIRYVKEGWGQPVAKSKLLPSQFSFAVDIVVAGDKLVFVSFNDMSAVLIENSAMADLQRQFLKFVWKVI